MVWHTVSPVAVCVFYLWRTTQTHGVGTDSVTLPPLCFRGLGGFERLGQETVPVPILEYRQYEI